jgi:tRNA N6-adenosine threonylcarbamoyltransferase
MGDEIVFVRTTVRCSCGPNYQLPATCDPSPSYNKFVPSIYILGIESSCDETAAAVVRSGEELISNVVYSQIATHQPFGGVVPELASREHLRAIVPVVRKALEDAGKTYESIDAIAVTQGPGLAGALLVGLSYAKTLAFAADKPLIAVNHLEGHIHAVLLEERQNGNTELQFPVLALVVSGGHTHLYLAERHESGWTYRNIGHTRDDAAGEAFDKVAKLLELGYPGGPVIDFLARHGNPQAVKFPFAQIKHRDRNPQNRHGAEEHRTDFSYSGIKTAVLRYVEVHNMAESIQRRREAMKFIAKPKPEDYLAACDRQTLDLVASFQRAIVDDLVSKTLTAAVEYGVATLLVTGGVAANSELRKTFAERVEEEGIPVLFPSRKLSTDNAAMIAAAAYPRFLAGEFAGADVSSDPGLKLGR